ncbi:putative transcription factor bHLH041 isoform X2 [Durio zibethinus]|uniref:Transcription factor bHLH041 isoform X2 n=1 Tax=Durio zibethinus TaxID=66656 RepID=A0A6P5XRA6_DURZI|nr:putative transcription factor bHLH041 isoform X2 [Durio zibethinus]
MDAVFHLDEASRAEFLQFLMHSTGGTYICLCCLIGWDGCFNEENTQPGALGLFVEYRQLIFPLENDKYDKIFITKFVLFDQLSYILGINLLGFLLYSGLFPGFAFRNNRPYVELGEPELRNRASHRTQRQFYQEAGIKTAVFMGCRSGEIELGFSNVVQLNMEMEVRSFFPDDFSRQLSSIGDQLPQPTDPNRPSSSSSSLRSLSAGSPDSSLIFTIPSASHLQVPTTETTTSSMQAISSPIDHPHQQAMQALSQMRSNIQLPTIESENDAMIKAILAVLTSPSSSSSSSIAHHPQQSQNLPHNYQLNPKACSAFKRYASALAPTTPVRASLRAQSMLKRAILFYRKCNLARCEQLLRSRPTSSQLHHMISERKRREKLNESFIALRSLLPSGTKKDKASVLTSARECLTSLKAQIVELSRQNQLLEAQLLPSREAAGGEANGSSNERIGVRITPASESTSEQRITDLRVSVRGERPIVDILIHLLEFLKLDRNVSLMSIEANTQITELGSVHHINLRLRIEGNGWDESSFQEAVRRLVADLAQ